MIAIILALLISPLQAKEQTCIASIYSVKSNGTKTVSGIPLNDSVMTAAHRTIKFGHKVRVTHKDQTVFVRITDRGPYVKGRCIDLSVAAGRALGCKGLCQVTVED
mgnify:CR=1 FL=1